MAQKESRLSRDIQKKLKVRYGASLFIFKVWGSEHMMAGLPDLIGCYYGKFFGLEVKRPETVSNTSARQEYVHGLIRRAGGLVAVVVSAEEAIEALNDL